VVPLVQRTARAAAAGGRHPGGGQAVLRRRAAHGTLPLPPPGRWRCCTRR
jgi:hypothetical protein